METENIFSFLTMDSASKSGRHCVKGHDEYLDVVGVIHDEERLFVSCSTKREFEVPFTDVQMQFKEVK